MTTLRDLHEKRGRAVAAMRALVENAGDTMTAEQSTEFDKLKGEVETLEQRIDRLQLLDDMDRRANGRTIAGSGDSKFDDEVRAFSLVRAIASQIPDLAGSVDAGREREVSAELRRRGGREFQGAVTVPLAVFEKRTMSANTATAGGFLVADQYRGDLFIDTLRARLVTGRLGASVLNGLSGQVNIPRRSTSSTAYWIAEDAAVTVSDSTFGQISMTPRTVGARTELTRNLMMQSSPSIEQLVRDDFASIIATAIDTAAVNGSGIGAEPKGLLQNSGLGTFSLSTVSYANVLAAIEDIETANSTATGWCTNPHVVKVLRSTVKVSGGVEGNFIMDGPDSLAGYPIVSSTIVPSNVGAGSNKSALIFGNWSDLIIGYWGSFDLLVNPYESTAYSKGNVQVRAMLTCDVNVRHAESFTVATDIT